MVDTGADCSLIDEKFVRLHFKDRLPISNVAIRISNVANMPVESKPCLVKTFRFSETNTVFFDSRFLVCNFNFNNNDDIGVSFDGILGADLLSRMGATINYSDKQMTLYNPLIQDKTRFYGNWELSHCWIDNKIRTKGIIGDIYIEYNLFNDNFTFKQKSTGVILNKLEYSISLDRSFIFKAYDIQSRSTTYCLFAIQWHSIDSFNLRFIKKPTNILDIPYTYNCESNDDIIYVFKRASNRFLLLDLFR